MFHRILLATDGSAPAERAADFAASLAARCGAQVIVLYALSTIPDYMGERTPEEEFYRTPQGAESLVTQAAHRLHQMGAPDVVTQVMEGPAGAVILHVAWTRSPDLIVMGARGRGVWHGSTLGSVSMTVASRAGCSVLIVK
jgi:nucleotide-binding universal stress UspA family protein